MQGRLSSRLLGIAIGERSIRFALLKRRGHDVDLVGTSCLVLADAFDARDPAELGAEIAAHLRTHGHRADRAVVGLGTRWLLVHHEVVPPADARALHGILRLRIEKRYVTDRRELRFDYQAAPAPDGQGGVLLVGAQRERLGRVQAVLASAGIVPIAVTASALATGSGAGRADGVVVLLDDDGASVLVMTGGQCASLVSCPAPSAELATDDGRHRFVEDLRRSVTLSGAHVPDEGLDVLLLDAAPRTDEDQRALGAAVGAGLGRCDVQVSHVPEQLVRAVLGRRSRLADLLAERLDGGPPRRRSRRRVWLGRVAIVLLVVAPGLGFFWQRSAAHVASLRRAHAAVRPEADRLEQRRLDVRAAAGWFDERPPILDCLLELTRAFPGRGHMWVTSLKLDASANGALKGKADDKAVMLDYVNAMQDSQLLDGVALRDWHETGRDARIVVFEIVFTFRRGATEPD